MSKFIDGVKLAATKLFAWGNSGDERSQISSPFDGEILLTDSGGSNFGLLQFGGITDAYPAWQRNGANFEAQKANGSGLTGVTASELKGSKARMTVEGGFAVKLTNKTGAASVKGELVKADTANDDAVVLTAANDDECYGVFYESGNADGAEAWIVVGGIAEVMLEDTTAATRGNWVGTSSTAGRADATSTSPPAAPDHFQETGHCNQTVTGGTDKLARCILHFN